MLRNTTTRCCRPGLVLAAVFAFVLVGMFVTVQAQTMSKVSGATQVSDPSFREYRGVTIGMSAEDVRQKLGAPKETSARQDFYARSENEFVQVFYDNTQKVTAVSINYVGEGGGAPACKAVFGIDVAAAADGSLNKLVRYPRAGYWVSYNRTGGTDPIVTLTMQKIKE